MRKESDLYHVLCFYTPAHAQTVYYIVLIKYRISRFNGYAKLCAMTNAHIFAIIRRLSDGQFHSGDTLAKWLRVSRSTIWNAIQTAKAMGVVIFSVRGRGYKLAKPVTLLDEKIVTDQYNYLRALDHIDDSPLAIEVFDQLPSTNGYLTNKLFKKNMHHHCVATNLQTQGRGRRGRVWQSALGESLTFSVAWSFQSGVTALSGLSLAVGVALIRALQHIGIYEAKLKWPNDIVIKNTSSNPQGVSIMVEKLAGILIELQGDTEGPSHAVIGIGINLTLSQKTKNNIDQASTDIASINSHQQDPNAFLARILFELEQVLAIFSISGFSALKEAWLSAHAYQQEMVRLIHPDGSEIVGIAQDITDQGLLLIETEQGLMPFSSGEISLRGVL